MTTFDCRDQDYTIRKLDFDVGEAEYVSGEPVLQSGFSFWQHCIWLDSKTMLLYLSNFLILPENVHALFLSCSGEPGNNGDDVGSFGEAKYDLPR